MRVVRDEDNRVKHLVFYESELCDQLNVTAEQIREWAAVFVPSGQDMHPDRETLEPVFHLTRDQLDRLDRYAKILKTGMTVAQAQELEKRDLAARKAGRRSNFLEMYALLAEECPAGITAHALRSYCVLLLYQNRKGEMLLASELAQVANLPEETALRHIKYLQATRLLHLAQNPQRWEFSFVPRALSRYYPS